ncbi:unnamed protein product [Vitrella brassicaformis CCMP3155]|uniref:Uncharacterized protein n=1 Tax=Vitrella brassicaformis (strain CCMP3155) TaxID=1169540 RepID=A0A0G4EP10_VITBC|nr:unnamed protein product [Vitrella brassicaformis CCMP3155]|eukprot:CEL99545.1 unnamed protein product [Vitrella brassicaformis CCMP3155]
MAAPSYENTPVRSHTDASFSRPTFLPTGAAHFENSPDLNLDAVLSLLESGDPDFDIDMDTLRSLYDKEGIPYEDDGPSSSAAAANAHPPPQRPAPASPPAEEPPSQTAEPPTHPATPLDGQPAASSNARDPLTIGRLAIWERGREGEHDILRGRRHRLLTGTEESEYEATVTSLSSDRASSTSEETAKHCWVAGGEGDGGGDGDSDGEPPGSLPPPIGIMADEPLSPASRLRVIEEAYFIYCRTGIEDAVANYMDALHVERARRGVRVRPHKRFTERVLERAYMTYIRTGSQDALANYYEALRQEPPSPVPVSIPPSLVVAERAGDGRDDPETTPEPPQHTTLLYLPLYIPTIEVFEQRVLERAYFRWLDTRCQDALHNYCEAFSREVWLLVDSLRSFDPLAFGDHLLDYDNDPIQLTPERISDFKNRVVTRAYFLWLDTMVDDQFYNHALAFRKELGILVEHAVQAQ